MRLALIGLSSIQVDEKLSHRVSKIFRQVHADCGYVTKTSKFPIYTVLFHILSIVVLRTSISKRFRSLFSSIDVIEVGNAVLSRDPPKKLCVHHPLPYVNDSFYKFRQQKKRCWHKTSRPPVSCAAKTERFYVEFS